MSDGLWLPTSDPNDPHGYQTDVQVPDACPGPMTLVAGTLTANFFLF